MPNKPFQEQQHPDNLLPWFVNNTLSFSQQKEVKKHLQHCSRCQNELSWLQGMRQAVKEAPTQSPGEFGLNRLLNDVRAEKEIVQPPRQLQSGSWWRGLAIAASLMILLQAGLLLDAWFLSKPLVPLAGPQEKGLVLQVSFAPTATEAQIRERVNAVYGSFIDGPGQLGIYRIRLDRLSTDDTNLQEAIEQLRQHKAIIRHVAQD